MVIYCFSINLLIVYQSYLQMVYAYEEKSEFLFNLILEKNKDNKYAVRVCARATLLVL
jgi:hypothetical protein